MSLDRYSAALLVATRPCRRRDMCAERARRFIGQLEVPTRLRDVEVPHAELPEIAESVMEEINRARTLERAIQRAELISLLEATYRQADISALA